MAHVYSIATSLHDLAGNFFQNVFHYQLTEAGVATPFGYADGLIDAWNLHCQADYLASFGNDVVHDFISAKRVTGGGGPSAQQTVALPGTDVQVSISAGMAADIAWQTASPLNRPGHTYMPCIPTGQVQGDFLQGPYLGALGAFRDDLLDTLALTGGLGNADFGVFSRKTSQFNKATVGQIKPKLTMLNKRTLPQV